MRSLRNPNRKPTHPGAVLREDVLLGLGWTQSSWQIGSSSAAKRFHKYCMTGQAVTADMAIRISSAVGGTPQSWLSMQQAVGLWDAAIKLESNPSLAPLFQPETIAA